MNMKIARPLCIILMVGWALTSIELPAQCPSCGGPWGSCSNASDCWGRGDDPQMNFSCDSGCCYGYYSPILIDLEGDGFSMTDPLRGVPFDTTGHGTMVRTAWTAPGSDDAWLALDRNGNGHIDSALELFGTATAQPEGPNRNGFEALAVYDRRENGGNGDGRISSADGIYAHLRLWQDRNHNGVSEPDELSTLAQRGILAISLDYEKSRKVDRYGNQFRFRARVHSSDPGDGRIKWAYDVFLRTTTAAN